MELEGQLRVQPTPLLQMTLETAISALSRNRHHMLYSVENTLKHGVKFFFLPHRFIGMKFKEVRFEDSLFEDCYFEDVTSSETFFENCTIISTVFYNTGNEILATVSSLSLGTILSDSGGKDDRNLCLCVLGKLIMSKKKKKRWCMWNGTSGCSPCF